MGRWWALALGCAATEIRTVATSQTTAPGLGPSSCQPEQIHRGQPGIPRLAQLPIALSSELISLKIQFYPDVGLLSSFSYPYYDASGVRARIATHD